MRIPCVERVDVAPFLELLIGLTVEDSLLEDLGINRVPEQLGQRGLRGTRRVEQALAGGNERGNARTDAPAERPEAFFMDVPGFATLRRQQLVVHRHEIIQERFVHLDEKTEQEGVTPRGGQTAQGMDIIAPREPRQVLNDARTDIAQVALVDPQSPDAMLAVEVGFDGRRGGFRRILLQGREGGLRLPRLDLH
jgi:hypothetical protein